MSVLEPCKTADADDNILPAILVRGFSTWTLVILASVSVLHSLLDSFTNITLSPSFRSCLSVGNPSNRYTHGRVHFLALDTTLLSMKIGCLYRFRHRSRSDRPLTFKLIFLGWHLKIQFISTRTAITALIRSTNKSTESSAFCSRSGC